MVIWLVGLSGSGKTTLGRELFNQWRTRAPNTVLLDGDEIRNIFKHDRTEDAYTIEGRRVNANRMVALCELLDKQGINVICCILSIFPEILEENRQRFSRYMEVFMDAPIEILRKRDVKGLYAAAARGEMKYVVGEDIPFEKPKYADMVIDSASECFNIHLLASSVLESAGL